MKITKIIDRKIALLREDVDLASYKDIYSPDYDRSVAEDALYHTIGPNTDNPRWSNDWTSQSEPVPGYVPGGPAPRWTDEEIMMAYAGDPGELYEPTNSLRSPLGSPMYRSAVKVARKYAKGKTQRELQDNILEYYSTGLAILTRILKEKGDLGIKPFISYVYRTIKGSMEHGIGGTVQSIMAKGGISKGHGVGSRKEEQKAASAGLAGLQAVLDTQNPEKVQDYANQVRGKFQTEKSYEKHPDNPFGNFSSKYYQVVSAYAEALKTGDEDTINKAKNNIEALIQEIEDFEIPIRGASTGGQAISAMGRGGSPVNVGSIDAPIAGSEDETSMAGSIPGDDGTESFMDPESIHHILNLALKHDLGKAIATMPAFKNMAIELSDKYSLGYKEGEPIGGPLTVNELRYVIRTLGPLGSNYPGRGNVRSNLKEPRDGIKWWKAGEDPEIEPIPGGDGIWNSIWTRNGYPQMGQTEIAAEMADEYNEFVKMGIPTKRVLKSKTDKSGKTYYEVASKVAVNVTLQKAKLKLVMLARMEKMHMNEGYDIDRHIIVETTRAIIKCIDRALYETNDKKKANRLSKELSKLPKRTAKIVSPMLSMNEEIDDPEMPSLLQVALYTPDRTYIDNISDMKRALLNSQYELDEDQTIRNDMIAMIKLDTEYEADRLIKLGEIILPNGSIMEIPDY